MNDDKLVRDMYSRLNLIINELHSIGLIKLDDADIMRKIISVLPQKKYASIIAILHNMEDLSTLTPAIVIGKIVTFEMSRKWVKMKPLHRAKAKLSHIARKRRRRANKLRQAQAQAPQVKMKKKKKKKKKMMMMMIMMMMMMMIQMMMINLPPPSPTLMNN